MIREISRNAGFSLIELGVAVFIIALLLGSILVPIASQVDQKQTSDTQKTLDEIREALVGFAVTNGYLPCPDTDNDGAENFNGGTGQCSTIASGIATGNLPWGTLGVSNTDLWGNRFRYSVNELFSRRSPATAFTLASVGTDVRVCAVAACTPAANVLTSNAIAAVVSHGKNGLGATSGTTGTANPAPSGTDELENTDGDRDLVSRIRTSTGAGAGEFDDLVIWLPRYFLMNRMVSAGRLP